MDSFREEIESESSEDEESSESDSSSEDSSDDSSSSDEEEEGSESSQIEDHVNENTWFFESYDHHTKANNIDIFIFWVTQVAASLFWCIFSFLKIISLSFFWGMLVFVSAYLSLTNLYAYYKCLKDHEAKLTSMLFSYSEGIMNVETLVEGVKVAKKLGRKVRKKRKY